MNTLVKTVLILVAASIAFAAGFLAQPENTVAAKAEPGASVIVPASGASGKAESVNPGDDESRLWSLVQAANSPWRLVEMEKEIAGLNFEQTLAAIERAKRTGTETRRALFHMLIVHAHGLSRERLREFIAPELTAMFASSSGMFGTRPALTWLTLYPDEALSIGKGRSSTSRHLLIGVYLAQMLVNQGAEGSAIQFPEDISLQEKGNISYSVMSEALRAGRLRDALPLLDVVETPMRAYLVERILESFTDKNRDPFGGLRMAQELRTKFGASVISPEQIEGIFSGIAANDISAAMKALETLPPEERTAAEFGILPQWIVKDPTAALAFAAGTGLLANEHFAENIGEIVAKNPVGILAAVHKMSPGTDRENAALILANSEHEWESPDALDTLLSSDARFQWELAAAAKAGKLVALIRALP